MDCGFRCCCNDDIIINAEDKPTELDAIKILDHANNPQ